MFMYLPVRIDWKNHSLKQVHMLVFTKRLQKNISNYKNILFLFIKFV